MMLPLTLVLAVAVLTLAATRSGARYRLWSTAPAIAGPNTLEELFAARYVRGEIDFGQYRTCVDRLTEQLHC